MKKLLATLVAWGDWGLFLASVLDGAGVPVPGGVDVLLVYLATRQPGRSLLLALVTVAGSTLGNLFLFSVARRGGEILLDRRTTSNASKRFRKWFDEYGLLTVFVSALVPLPVMPMKIFVLCSGALKARTANFLVVFVIARVLRYTGLAWLGRQMGDNALQYLRDHVWHLAAGAAVLFVLLWLIVRTIDRRHVEVGNTV